MSVPGAAPTSAGAVESEERGRLRMAPVAILAGVLLLGAAVIQLGGPHAKVNEETIGLITVSKRGAVDIIGAILNALALGLTAGALNFLYEATRRRQPTIGAYLRALAVLGGVITGITGVIYAIVVHAKAHQFVTQGSQTYEEANHLTHSFAFTVLPTLELAAALALALAFVLISLGAMRVGLLTRFMGYLGIFTGVLVLIPIGSPVPVVEAFWLVALGVLFAGRWPNGMPPAWESGIAQPWPSSQEMREQRVRAAGARGQGAAAGAGGKAAGGKGAGGKGAGGKGAGALGGKGPGALGGKGLGALGGKGLGALGVKGGASRAGKGAAGQAKGRPAESAGDAQAGQLESGAPTPARPGQKRKRKRRR